MAHYKGAASEAGRAMHLMKKREMAQQEIEFRKKKIEEDLKISNIENKFAAHYDAVEQQLKSSTIGLVTLDEMKAKQESIVKQREKKLAQKQLEKEREEMRLLEAKKAEKYRQKQQIQALSFTMDDGEEEEDDDDDNIVDLKKVTKNVPAVKEEESKKLDAKKDEVKKEVLPSSDSDNEDSQKSNDHFSVPPLKKIRKNPDVDTSFLPDREREEEENKLREELRQEWASKQASLKEEEIDITFSYWDGSGHRRTVRMKKGNSMYQFLQRCLDLLRKEFSELKTVSADQLMYVKEDLILPHHYTFYDFIVTKARGKSGPLFTFDVHDDVRLVSDASVEKEESHAGKVLLRHWYERNKHIFPASRWEPYDPTKSYDKYTVSDKCKKAHMPSITYLRLDGSIPAGVRHSVVARFNSDPSIDVLLLTTQVGGLGLNLTGADTVIFVEHDWNPMKDLQAMDRAHRIGQRKVVNVYRLITRSTLEEKIMGLQKFKLLTANTVISSENASIETMGTDQLLDLFSLNEKRVDDNSKKEGQPSSSSSFSGGSSGRNVKSLLDSLPELWEDKQYEEEYDLSAFIESLKKR